MSNKILSIIQGICYLVVIAGGLCWGILGFFELNLIQKVFGSGMVTRGMYALIGTCALISTILTVKFTMDSYS